MASSKTFLLLGLMFAVVILIFSEVSARELAAVVGPIHNGGKGGAASCNRFERNCREKGNNKPGPEHCKDPTTRECHKHGGHNRGGEEDPIHKRHGHEHGGEHDPNHGGKGGAVPCNRPDMPCHGRGGKLDPIHGGKRHGHEGGGEGDPFNHGRTKNPGRPGEPGTAETETKN